MRIAMVGAGYVGLVSGACFSDFGHDVVCVDIDAGRIAALQAGSVPIYEPGLEQLIRRNVEAGRLSFTTELAGPAAEADVIFIAVSAPSRRGDGHADISFIEQAASGIAPWLDGFTVVAMKSTVPLGTGDIVERIIRDARPDADLAVVANPEFLREGAAIEDFKRPDRIVIGSDDERALALMREVYRPLYLNRAPIVEMSRGSAELAKYVGNAFLATKIAFINEIADLCERVDTNIQDIARAIGLDRRIGSQFLNAGPGFGGSCFPKDTRALLQTANDVERPLQIVEAVMSANDKRKYAMGRKVINAVGGSVAGKRIAILGLTFKPNTDDMRESPAIAIIDTLQHGGASVAAYDPEGMKQAAAWVENVEYFSSPYEAVENADAVVIVTEWDEFRALDLKKVKDRLQDNVLVDLRNIYNRREVEMLGIKYIGVGK